MHYITERVEFQGCIFVGFFGEIQLTKKPCHSMINKKVSGC